MFNWIRRRITARGGWSAARRIYISSHPFCEVCGYLPKGSLSLANDVHHIIPQHIDPSKTTDQTNLITLCRKYDCHLRFGHFGDYRRCWNQDIRAMFPGTGQLMLDAESQFRQALPTTNQGIVVRTIKRIFGDV